MNPDFGVPVALSETARRRLLVARLAFHGRFRDEDGELVALPASVADSDALLACADDEDLLTLTVRALLATPRFDAGLIGERWHARAAERRRWSEMRLRLLQTLFDALMADGVDAIVIKGSPLSHELYGDPHLRDHHDIDLVVAPGQAHAAARVLSRYGPVPACDIGWFARPLFLRSLREASFRSLGGAFEVDLHWRIDQPWNPQWTPVEPLLATAVPIRLPGAVTVRTQSPLATHRLLASNLVGSGMLELRSIVDWAKSLHNHGSGRLTALEPHSVVGGEVWHALTRLAGSLLRVEDGALRIDGQYNSGRVHERRIRRAVERWCMDVLGDAAPGRSNRRFIADWRAYGRLMQARLCPGMADYGATAASDSDWRLIATCCLRRLPLRRSGTRDERRPKAKAGHEAD